MNRREEILSSVRKAVAPAVVVDFDGTISRIVEHPGTARPVSGAVGVLNALSRTDIQVAVLSGRPVAFLQRVLEGLSSTVQLIGHSGLERAIAGRIAVEPQVEVWLPTIRAAYELALQLAPERLLIEDKRLSFSIHYRGAADLESEAVALGERVGTGGLSVEPGKMHVEIRPPLAVDKGTALKTIVSSDVDWSLYAGDDVVDLPAFAAVRSSSLGASFCVAVGTEESPSELLDAADLVLVGPDAIVDLLADLVTARSSDPAGGS